MSRNKQTPDLTIFEIEKKAKLSAFKTLEIAKQQEADKLKNGYSYKAIDGKTMILTKNN